MNIDPTIYANLMLTAIAVLLFLLFLTAILILLRLKMAFPAKIEEKTDKMLKKAQKAVINEEPKKEEKEDESDPSKMYRDKSIEQNLIELFKHYSLNSFTMATSDGLVISSTDSNPDEDAANYSHLYLKGKQPESPSISLIGVPHKGETIVGIIKSEDELSKKDLVLIERDIRYILRRNL